MTRLPRLLALTLLCAAVGGRASHTAPTVFINEIHYDNTGTDAGEFVEIAGPAGTDLSGYSIVLYNGANGLRYDTDALSGTIPDQQNGFGTVSLRLSGRTGFRTARPTASLWSRAPRSFSS